MKTKTQTTTRATSKAKKERVTSPFSEPSGNRRSSNDVAKSQPKASSEDRHLTRRMTRGEITLHHTKLGLSDAQDERTRIRIQQLYDDDEQAEEDDEQGMVQEEDAECEDVKPSVIPSTALRQNITKRISQGRAKDRESIGSTSIPLQDLLSRKPNPRSKDALYKQESTPIPQKKKEILMNGGYHPSSPKNSLKTATPTNVGSQSSPPKSSRVSDDSIQGHPEFTFRMIPRLEDGPILHAKLKRTWMEKKDLEEEMQMAYDDGDEIRFRQLESHHDFLNSKMFTVLSKAKMHEKTMEPVHSSDDEYDTPPEHEHSQSESESDDEAQSQLDQTEQTGGGLDWCYDGSSYIIYLKFSDEKWMNCVPWVVWPHMPVSILAVAAVGVLSEHGRSINVKDIILMYNGTVMDTVSGRLSDHPVNQYEEVGICVSETRGGQSTRNGKRINKKGGRGSPNPSDPSSDSSASSSSVSSSQVSGSSYGGARKPGRHSNLGPGFRANFKPPNLGNADTTVGNSDSMKTTGASNSLEKLRQAFKCPRFTGNAKDWKTWDKGFQRYLAIWDLDHVLDPAFFGNEFQDVQLSSQKLKENKLVYYLIEDATQGSPIAASYVRQAPVQNGFEAYYTLHDGYVFAGATTSTLLLNELTNFRFQQDESPTALIMRLEELFQDLEMLPDGASMKFNDTQQIGYLLGALRHEAEWDTVTSYITSSP